MREKKVIFFFYFFKKFLNALVASLYQFFFPYKITLSICLLLVFLHYNAFFIFSNYLIYVLSFLVIYTSNCNLVTNRQTLYFFNQKKKKNPISYCTFKNRHFFIKHNIKKLNQIHHSFISFLFFIPFFFFFFFLKYWKRKWEPKTTQISFSLVDPIENRK